MPDAQHPEEKAIEDSATQSEASHAESFARDGYVVLHGLIPRPKIERALRYLNHHLGSADLANDLEPEGLVEGGIVVFAVVRSLRVVR